MATTTAPPHVKCRYPNKYEYKGAEGTIQRIDRQEVPVDLIPWDAPFASYDPPTFTATFVLKALWADPVRDEPSFKPKWNQVDGKINRKTFEGEYKVTSSSSLPLNIRGRTGLQGRGVLGRWGPNHAADPIVTRWKRDDKGQKVVDQGSGKPVLQFVAIQRRDTKEWAIPGGMVDPGEQVSVTVRREFMEEALDSTQARPEDKEKMKQMVEKFFDGGKAIYEGYVDDPRNTDNSWMETVAFLFHDDCGREIGKFDLKAGDDAQALKWIDLSRDVRLYASHEDFVKKAAEMQGAHW